MSVGILTVFAAGLLTYLTPCVLPLVPIYLAALSGGDVRDLGAVARGRLVGRAVAFSAGFTAVFIALGSAASALGGMASRYQGVVQALGAVLIVLFGLKLLGLVHIPLLERTVRGNERRALTPLPAINAALMGVFFAAAWSPCVGPVLGAVLTYTATQQSDPWVGAGYLLVYSAGFAVPLVLTAAFVRTGLSWLAALRPYLPTLERLTGAALLLVGLGLLLDAVPTADEADTTAPLAATQRAAMIELYASDCPVCQRMAPVVQRLAHECEDEGVAIEQIDVSTAANNHLARRHRLVGVPTFLFVDASGREVARLVGQHSESALRQALSAVRGEQCDGVGMLPPTRAPTPDPTSQQEIPCPSTNTAATAAAAASNRTNASPSAINPSAAASATAPPAACSLLLP